MPLKGHAYVIFPALDKETAEEMYKDIHKTIGYEGRVYIPKEDK